MPVVEYRENPGVERPSGAPSNRFALVIGCNEYKYGPPLAKAVNDAEDIHELLKTAGFQSTFVKNGTCDEMYLQKHYLVKHVTQYQHDTPKGEPPLVVVFFSGHGADLYKKTHLLAVNEPGGLEVNSLLSELNQEAKGATCLILTDACRDDPNNPAFRSIHAKKGAGDNSITSEELAAGLNVAKAELPSFTLKNAMALHTMAGGAQKTDKNKFVIIYACQPGTVALESRDTEQRNGFFTKALLKHLPGSPGGDLMAAFQSVVEEVEAWTDGRQTPWMEGDFRAMHQITLFPTTERGLSTSVHIGNGSGEQGMPVEPPPRPKEQLPVVPPRSKPTEAGVSFLKKYSQSDIRLANDNKSALLPKSIKGWGLATLSTVVRLGGEHTWEFKVALGSNSVGVAKPLRMRIGFVPEQESSKLRLEAKHDAMCTETGKFFFIDGVKLNNRFFGRLLQSGDTFKLHLDARTGHAPTMQLQGLSEKVELPSKWGAYRPCVGLFFSGQGVEVLASEGDGETATPIEMPGPIDEDIDDNKLGIGQDDDDPSDHQKTLYLKAVKDGRVEDMERLLQTGVDLESKDKMGVTALHLAACKGQLEAVKFLLTWGHNIHATTENREESDPAMPSLHDLATSAAAGIDISNALRRYLKARNGSSVPDLIRGTPLHCAAFGGHSEVVEALLQAGANPSDPNGAFGRTPLHCAALQGHLEVMITLLDQARERFANINARDKNSRTPLALAASGGHLEAGQLLFDLGAEGTTEQRVMLFAMALPTKYLTDNREGAKACLETLRKVCDNVVKNPADPKFQKIKQESETVKNKVKPFEGALPLLDVVGFKPDATGEFYAIQGRPDIATLQQAVRHIDAALQKL